MNYLTDEKFSFESKAVKKDTFGVVKFSGSEGLSRLYRFEIMLIAEDFNINMNDILQAQATFFIHRPDGSKVPFHGIVSEIELMREVGGYYLYRAVLVPKLWHLTLTRHNQIFLEKNPEDIISSVLEDGGLSSSDYDFRLQGSYVTWDYACQYGESHYNFIARWMEQNGMYYFFDQSGAAEKLVITDTKTAHAPANIGEDVTYSPVSGLEAFHINETVQAYICKQRTIAKKVMLKDYDYRKPSLEVVGEAQVSDNGVGEMYFYGDHFRTPEEGNKLAHIRSEEILCQAQQFHGESTVPYIAPGFVINMNDHFHPDYNRKYLVTSINHHGNQASALISGLREELAGSEQESVYRNTFTAIGSDVQFRPERVAERPKLHGTINARIDASESGKYSEVDDQGRYKVILPFDRSGREDGKASAWVRMMQPYVGSDHGMHFPLHKGAEVLLTFIDGDPDRPVIAGAVPNPENPSLIASGDQTMAKLSTSGGNKIHIEDKEGSERILLHSPNQNSFIRIGHPSGSAGSNASSSASGTSQFTPPDPKPTPPDPPPAPPDKSWGDKWKEQADNAWRKWFGVLKVDEDHPGIHLATGGSFDVVASIENKIILGEESKSIGGLAFEVVLGNAFHLNMIGYEHIVLGGVADYHFPEKWEVSNFTSKLHTQMNRVVASAHTAMTTDKNTIVAAAHTDMTTDKNTIVAAAHTDMTTDKNTIVAAAHNDMTTEKNTIVATARADFADLYMMM